MPEKDSLFQFIGELSGLRKQARIAGVHPNTVTRWHNKYKIREDLRDLANEDPGPAKGTGMVLDSSMRAHIKRCWEIDKLTRAQTVRSLETYLEEKQRGCGPKYIYDIPHRTTVERFINKELQGELNPIRRGEEFLHRAAGKMDRTYTDLATLERVETDECKLNIFGWNPLKPFDKEGKALTPRYWLLTFYDCRSIYPLVWNLVTGSAHDLKHGISEQDEINLLTRLVREYGCPAAIHSDRGRFRGKTFGGAPLGEDVDARFKEADGILNHLDIRHNMPRVHNPRGTRLERFHGWVADWFRGKPGWIGANVTERKMSNGDADQARHAQWLAGKLTPGERSPLLTVDEIRAELNAMMEKWRDHSSEGTDMHGLSPRAVFVHSTPAGGFRKVSDEILAIATAERYQDETIEPGGIIVLPDKTSYSHPLLTQWPGECREVIRLRTDHSYISVLPDQKGEEVVLAPRRVRVGTKDQEALAEASELQARVKNVIRQFGQGKDEAPNAVAIEAAVQAVDPKDDYPEISSMEWQQEKRSRVAAAPAIEAEADCPFDEEPHPSLYDLKEISAEEL